MNIIGIDIGTTTISVIAVDRDNGKIVRSTTVASDSFIETQNEFEKKQSVEIIESKVMTLLQDTVSQCRPVCSIGVTGQMHGILYTDANGNFCSPLYTWQDGRANEPFSGKLTYCGFIEKETGYKISVGYGLATHFYNMKNGIVPEKAEHLCTVHDYIAMRICKKTVPVTHTSDAASLGLFDFDSAEFDGAAISKLGMDKKMLPDVLSCGESVGNYNGIPVSVAIGDNQASFIGSVKESNRSVLINIGTGSQISVAGTPGTSFPSGEIRPLDGKSCILVGSALCGGRAFAVLENFFRETFKAYDGNDDSAYKFMDSLAEKTYPAANPLKVDTSFCGTRKDPEKRGSIENICIDNLTPQQLICGVLNGTVTELYDMYREVSSSLETKPDILIGSGNGIRKSPVWRRIAEDTFGMKMFVPAHKEEAAFGAAVFSLAANGICKSVAEAQQIIRYTDI